MRWKFDRTACDKKAIKEAPKARPGLVFFSRSRPRVEERRRDAPAVAKGDVANALVAARVDEELENETRAAVGAMGSVCRGRRGKMDARREDGSTKAQKAGGTDATMWLVAKKRSRRG